MNIFNLDRNPWKRSEKSLYQLQRSSRTWQQARDVCIRKGAHLVDIDSEEENTFVANFADTGGLIVNYWIGVNDLDSENDFRGSDGSTHKFFNWREGEPNNSKEEDCIEVIRKAWSLESKWNDIDCSESRPFVCEKGMFMTCDLWGHSKSMSP